MEKFTGQVWVNLVFFQGCDVSRDCKEDDQSPCSDGLCQTDLSRDKNNINSRPGIIFKNVCEVG